MARPLLGTLRVPTVVPVRVSVDAKRRLRRRRGAISVEYLLVVAFIGLTTAIAIASVIPRVRASYAAETEALSQPYP